MRKESLLVMAGEKEWLKIMIEWVTRETLSKSRGGSRRAILFASGREMLWARGGDEPVMGPHGRSKSRQ